MRAVKRWRYYCDYCGAVKGHKSVMEKHERRCTLNPDRECGFCILADGVSTEFKGLLVLAEIAAPQTKGPDTNFLGIVDALESNGEAWLKVYREITNNCPGCILALIRQHGNKKDDCVFNTFDFKAEAQSYLDEEAKRE